MPSLTNSFDIFLTVASWIGFALFTVCALFGAWFLGHIIVITAKLTYARWRWKKYQRAISEDGNYLLAHELSQHFIREINKTEATEPKVNPYAPVQPTHTTNDTTKQATETRRRRSP
jgi:hypothetical protein